MVLEKCPYCGYEVHNLEEHLSNWGDKGHALFWAVHHKMFMDKVREEVLK